MGQTTCTSNLLNPTSASSLLIGNTRTNCVLSRKQLNGLKTAELKHHWGSYSTYRKLCFHISHSSFRSAGIGGIGRVRTAINTRRWCTTTDSRVGMGRTAAPKWSSSAERSTKLRPPVSRVAASTCSCSQPPPLAPRTLKKLPRILIMTNFRSYVVLFSVTKA